MQLVAKVHESARNKSRELLNIALKDAGAQGYIHKFLFSGKHLELRDHFPFESGNDYGSWVSMDAGDLADGHSRFLCLKTEKQAPKNLPSVV